MQVGLVFDLDGTLVTFNFDIPGTRKAMIEELSARGFDTSELTLTSLTYRILEVAREQIDSGSVNASFDDVRTALYSILDAFELRNVSRIKPLPGSRQALERLKKNSARLAVLTNSGRNPATKVLRRSGMLDLFEFVLTRDDLRVMKPDPEGALKAVSMLSLPKEQVYLVGDSIVDVSAGKRAGLRVISVATGNYSPERLREEGADFILSSLDEIPKILNIHHL